jgi:hypothetical protein
MIKWNEGVRLKEILAVNDEQLVAMDRVIEQGTDDQSPVIEEVD